MAKCKASIAGFRGGRGGGQTRRVSAAMGSCSDACATGEAGTSDGEPASRRVDDSESSTAASAILEVLLVTATPACTTPAARHIQPAATPLLTIGPIAATAAQEGRRSDAR